MLRLVFRDYGRNPEITHGRNPILRHVRDYGRNPMLRLVFDAESLLIMSQKVIESTIGPGHHIVSVSKSDGGS